MQESDIDRWFTIDATGIHLTDAGRRDLAGFRAHDETDAAFVARVVAAGMRRMMRRPDEVQLIAALVPSEPADA